MHEHVLQGVSGSAYGGDVALVYSVRRAGCGVHTAAEIELLSSRASRFWIALAQRAQDVGTYKQAASQALEFL